MVSYYRFHPLLVSRFSSRMILTASCLLVCLDLSSFGNARDQDSISSIVSGNGRFRVSGRSNAIIPVVIETIANTTPGTQGILLPWIRGTLKCITLFLIPKISVTMLKCEALPKLSKLFNGSFVFIQFPLKHKNANSITHNIGWKWSHHCC